MNPNQVKRFEKQALFKNKNNKFYNLVKGIKSGLYFTIHKN